MTTSRKCAERAERPARRPYRLWLAVVAPLAFAAACILRPEWQRLAGGDGLATAWIDTGEFAHLVIANDRPGERLRIYIGGDGLPWIRERRVSIDPTPANPILLRLMVLDTSAAIFLGRPCYFGTATSERCGPELWTSRRYAEPVIRSMCAAANRISAERGAAAVELLGYSGGGAIAVAMRGCTERLAAITTIAANLDVHAWTEYHRYTPLVLSPRLEPRDGGGTGVRETHWQCRGDLRVPPRITDAWFAVRRQARRIIVDECSHADGWERYRSRIVGSGNEPFIGGT